MTNIWIGKEIEVIHINPLVKSIGIVIHHYQSPTEFMLPDTQMKIIHLVEFGVQYLLQEGFVSGPLEEWLTHVGGVTHTK